MSMSRPVTSQEAITRIAAMQYSGLILSIVTIGSGAALVTVALLGHRPDLARTGLDVLGIGITAAVGAAAFANHRALAAVVDEHDRLINRLTQLEAQMLWAATGPDLHRSHHN